MFASRKYFRDPRYAQILILSTLLLYGKLALNFSVSFEAMGMVLAVALAAQYCASRWWCLPRFDPKSAFISSLSLCLLLRVDSLWLYALAAVFAIFSKFIFRTQQKHFFNPTNFGIVAVLLLFDGAWVSPGQWGTPALLILALACLGLWVVNRAARSDVCMAFLLSYAAIGFGRAWWLGDAWQIPWHQLQSGGLILFAFFMISDPKTTPNSFVGRVLFGFLVALIASVIAFVFYQPNGIFWALAVVSLITPWLDRLLPGPSYQWPQSSWVSSTPQSGRAYEPLYS